MAKKRKTRLQKEKSQARRAASPPKTAAAGPAPKASAYERHLQSLQAVDIETFPWTAEEHSLRDDLRYVINARRASGDTELRVQAAQLWRNLIHRCEALHTPLLCKNDSLRSQVRETMIPYYQGSFQINMSREISFLPLDLRLLIYTELLFVEDTLYQCIHILDRIATTLCKMDCADELDLCIFVLSWAQYNLFMTCPFIPSFRYFGYDAFQARRQLDSLLRFNQERFCRIKPLREKTIETAMLDGAERLDQEFWYGVNCFSNLNAINDRHAAEMCLKLFTNYFEKVFLCAAEFERLTLDLYRNGNKAQLNSFLERHQLDEIDMQSYKSYIIL